jgi:hypothetical protein
MARLTDMLGIATAGLPVVDRAGRCGLVYQYDHRTLRCIDYDANTFVLDYEDASVDLYEPAGVACAVDWIKRVVSQGWLNHTSDVVTAPNPSREDVEEEIDAVVRLLWAERQKAGGAV